MKIDKLEYRSNAGLIGENSFYLSRVYRSQSFDFQAPWASTYHLLVGTKESCIRFRLDTFHLDYMRQIPFIAAH